MPTPARIQLPQPIDVNSFLSEPEPEYDWCVPGLFEYGDRAIITGNEGKGKSTLLRQIGVQVAAGIHPFTLAVIDPRRVLILDLENPRPTVRREIRKIKGQHEIESGYLTIQTLPEGLDLSQDAYKAAVLDLLIATKPEVVIVGPTYKMAPDLDTEAGSAALAFQLDQWRIAGRFVLLMESHQPHDRLVDGRPRRPERPYGSSLWMRWPEFGICLWDDGTLKHWRGARDADRDWPARLYRGGSEWLWETQEDVCLKCGEPLIPSARLGGAPKKFCSPKCGNAWRQQEFRRGHSLGQHPLQ